jgi:hypothetical protein
MVLSAAPPEKLSFEASDWKHGALSLGLLEALQGRSELEPGKLVAVAGSGAVVNLHDVIDYVKRRVRKLTKAKLGTPQAPRFANDPHLDPMTIPVRFRAGPAR